MDAKDSPKSWLVLCSVSYVYFLETGLVKGLGVLLPDIKEQLGSETWIIGSCVSIMISFGYLLGLSANALKKRFGARFCFMMSGFVTSIGVIICAYATNVYAFLFGIILIGFVCFQENIATGIVPEYFDKYYDTAVTFYSFGGGLSVVIVPPILQLFQNIYGWQGTMLMVSGISFQTMIFGTIVKTSVISIYRPNNSSNQSTMKTAQHNQTGSLFLNQIDANILTNIPFIIYVLIPGMATGCLWAGWAIYIVSFALSLEMTMKEASIVATCGGIGLMTIRPILALLQLFATYKQIMYISSITMAVSLLMPLYIPTVVGLCISSWITCMGLGMQTTENYIAIRDTTEENQYVSGIAWYHLFFGFASTLGSILTGFVFDVSGSYNISFIFLSVVSLIIAVTLGARDLWLRLSKSHQYTT